MLNLYKPPKHDFNEGDKVYYISEDGEYLKAEIIKIHHDDEEPYYTINLNKEKREKQTVYKKLKPIDNKYIKHAMFQYF